MMLPEPLVWVLDLIGINWPDIDEDDLHAAADELRSVASELDSHTDKAKDDITKMLGSNSAQSLELFNQLWTKVSGDHLPQLVQGLNLLADALDASADLVVGLKVAAIAQLVALAAEIIADEAAAPFTFGISEAAVPVEIAATRGITKALLDKAVDAVEQQLMGVIEGQVFDALGSAATELATQLLGDAVGVGSGVDVDKVVKAAV